MSPLARPGLRTEVATWRPVEVVDVDGWRVGLSGGFTRRGNSVAPVRAPGDVERALDEVEAVYAGRGLPAVVRVCEDAAPAGLDARLEQRGYTVAAPTSVMVRDVLARPEDDAAPPSYDATDHPTSAWLGGWLGVKAAEHGVDVTLAGRLVRGAPAEYLAVRDGDEVVAVLRAATADGWVGLSCLAVAPRARGTGLGRGLTVAAVERARARGARQVFLQVEEANTAAIGLYERLGFEVADRYHYRERALVRPEPPARETLDA